MEPHYRQERHTELFSWLLVVRQPEEGVLLGTIYKHKAFFRAEQPKLEFPTPREVAVPKWLLLHPAGAAGVSLGEGLFCWRTLEQPHGDDGVQDSVMEYTTSFSGWGRQLSRAGLSEEG